MTRAPKCPLIGDLRPDTVVVGKEANLEEEGVRC